MTSIIVTKLLACSRLFISNPLSLYLAAAAKVIFAFYLNTNQAQRKKNIRNPAIGDLKTLKIRIGGSGGVTPLKHPAAGNLIIMVGQIMIYCHCPDVISAGANLRDLVTVIA
jgi:hypothetical protein